MNKYNKNHSQPVDTNQDLGSIISSNLKRLIAQNKTTQKELADKLGVMVSMDEDLHRTGRRVQVSHRDTRKLIINRKLIQPPL